MLSPTCLYVLNTEHIISPDRLSAHLLEQMKAVAKQNNRSLNGEVLTALEEHIKKQRKRN